MNAVQQRLVCVAIVMAVGVVHAADDKKGQATVLKTQDGLHFQLPPDWPIEKRGGAVGPIPVEEYLSRKFTALDQRIRAIEQQTSALDIRLRVLEEEIKKQQRLKSGEGIP